MTDISLTPAIVEGEPRIRDVELAVRLGFSRPDDIRKLIKRHAESLNKISVLATAAQTTNPEKGGRPATAYYLNRKQAIFVTMKSETATATEVTLEIIERFDAYERGLKPASVDPMKALNDPAIMRGLLLSYSEKVLALEQKAAELTPKAEALDRIAKADGDFCITDAAKTLQIRPKDLFQYLRAADWIYKRVNTTEYVGYQERLKSGDLEHKTVTIQRADGTDKVVTRVRVTAKGLVTLAKAMKKAVKTAPETPQDATTH